MAHPFWDKYIEFEERLEDYDRVFAILTRIIHIPMHQYARYTERFRQLSQSRLVTDLVPSETIAQFRAEITMEGGPGSKSETDVERELRQRIENRHTEIFQKTQTETTKRWTYEQEMKRPYFHVTDLDDSQLANWRKYLDFEEKEGDRERIVFLYERCLVTAAYYEEFWLRYVRWMLGQFQKNEEVRHMYMRACLFLPIARPAMRLQWALFEEKEGRIAIAHAIYDAILAASPGLIEAIVAWANSQRRQYGLDNAVDLFKSFVNDGSAEPTARISVLTEWASLLWKVKGSPEEARQVYMDSHPAFAAHKSYWDSFLAFEMDQPAVDQNGDAGLERVKTVFEEIRKKTSLDADAVREIAEQYQRYLLARGGKDAAKEYLSLEREINHP